ncbi:MAG: hypothetical protein FWH46_00370 [Methanimicrococcus sp.]|nr:hypothetical protein [Methanimicrococcus sp.]
MFPNKAKKSKEDIRKPPEPSDAAKKAAAEIFGLDKQSSLIIKPGFEKLRKKKLNAKFSYSLFDRLFNRN